MSMPKRQRTHPPRSSTSTGDAALGSLDKADQVPDLRVRRGVRGLERAQRGGEVAVFLEEQLLVGTLDRLDVLFRKAAALKADEVDPSGLTKPAEESVGKEGRKIPRPKKPFLLDPIL